MCCTVVRRWLRDDHRELGCSDPVEAIAQLRHRIVEMNSSSGSMPNANTEKARMLAVLVFMQALQLHRGIAIDANRRLRQGLRSKPCRTSIPDRMPHGLVFDKIEHAFEGQ